MTVMILLHIWILCAFCAYYGARGAQIGRGGRPGAGMSAVDWVARGQQDLTAALNWWPAWKPAKNVVFILGDGMGISTQTAARFFKAQRQNIPIVESTLAWDHFHSTGTIKTYNTDQQVGDSAACANAFLSGEKTRSRVVGYNQHVIQADCSTTSPQNQLTTLIEYALMDGRKTGIVTTTRITHASVAAAYAHAPERTWESDADIPPDQKACTDIAWQLVKGQGNSDIRVILGGGRKNLMTNETFDNEHPLLRGVRTDGVDLIQEWLDIHKNKGLLENQYKYVENLTQFESVDASEVEYLLGLFEPSHMHFEADRESDVGGEPSLAEMAGKALDILQNDGGDKGFFLFIEGGRIDHGNHFNQAYKALRDTLALEEAVQVVLDKTSEEDTLVVVTSDHSHTLTIGGYPDIDNNILGVAVNEGETMLGNDGKPFLTLGYSNGPGFYVHRTVNGSLSTEKPRENLTSVTTNGTGFMQDAGVPLTISTHSGEDVAVFARGPMDHLFVGVHEQSYIAHAMGYITCLGWNTALCSPDPPEPPGCPGPVTDAASNVGSRVHLYITAIAVVLLIH